VCAFLAGFGPGRNRRFLISTMYPTICAVSALGLRDIGTITGALEIAWGGACAQHWQSLDRIVKGAYSFASLVAFSLLIGASGLAAGLAGLVAGRLVWICDGAFNSSPHCRTSAVASELHVRPVGLPSAHAGVCFRAGPVAVAVAPS